MLKLMLALAVLAALAGAVAFVPLRGRSVLDRWSASRSPREFVERGWAEAKASFGVEAPRPRPARATSRPAKPARAHRPAEEQHTEEDRAALDRIVAEHASRP
jgi:hypothetical protein